MTADKTPYIPPTTLRVLASTIGAFVLSILIAAALARFLPLPSPAALAVAYALWLPIWVASACWIARCRSAGRAWLVVVASAAAVGLPVYLVPH